MAKSSPESNMAVGHLLGRVLAFEYTLYLYVLLHFDTQTASMKHYIRGTCNLALIAYKIWKARRIANRLLSNVNERLNNAFVVIIESGEIQNLARIFL